MCALPRRMERNRDSGRIADLGTTPDLQDLADYLGIPPVGRFVLGVAVTFHIRRNSGEARISISLGLEAHSLSNPTVRFPRDASDTRTGIKGTAPFVRRAAAPSSYRREQG